MDLTSPPPQSFEDRKLGLILFGIVTIILGCLTGLFVLLLIFAGRIAPPPPNGAAPPNVLPVAVLYGAVAVILIWLGAGSMLARRWARALLAIGAWSTFAIGLLTCILLAFMAPHLAQTIRAAQPPGRPQLSASAQVMVMVFPALFLAFVFVLVPLVWGLFYGGRNVKATCEARDPVVRWTDRCPLPVLAASLWFGFGALTLLGMPAFHPVAPLFGALLAGMAGTVFYLGLAVVWGYAAWAIYRLDRRGWRIIFGAMILFAVSNVITYSRHEMSEIYALMGYPPAQVQQMQAIGFSGSSMVWWSVIFVLPLLAYLCYIWKFFGRGREVSSEIAR